MQQTKSAAPIGTAKRTNARTKKPAPQHKQHDRAHGAGESRPLREARAKAVPIILSVEVSAEVAEGIRALNASVGWDSNTPCDEHSIAYLVEKMDQEGMRKFQAEKLGSNAARAFLDLYEVITELPFKTAIESLRSLAVLTESVLGLDQERFGLQDIAKTDELIRSLRHKPLS